MKTRSIATALAGVVMGCASVGTVQAALVTDWTATVTGEWTDWEPSGVSHNATTKTLSWGTPTTLFGDQSSLDITDPAANQSVQTQITGGSPQPGTTADGVTLTHNNNPIFAPSLESAVLTATIDLTATQPSPQPGGPGMLPPLTYDILFSETTNSEPCVADSPAGNPCNDIFVQETGFLNQTLNFDGEEYFINIFPVAGGALQTLSAAECADAGAASGCLGFTTIEGQANDLEFGFTISAERFSTEVPEPGSLALLGLGLVAGGAARRRRSQH